MYYSKKAIRLTNRFFIAGQIVERFERAFTGFDVGTFEFALRRGVAEFVGHDKYFLLLTKNKYKTIREKCKQYAAVV